MSAQSTYSLSLYMWSTLAANKKKIMKYFVSIVNHIAIETFNTLILSPIACFPHIVQAYKTQS